MGQTYDSVAEIAHTSDKVLGNSTYVTGSFKVVTGAQAFRDYDWRTDRRVLNPAGNFRAMVISARWGRFSLW
jgi:hypothetical protein